MTEAYVDEGILVNSGQFDGMENTKFWKQSPIFWKLREGASGTIQYRLRDWGISASVTGGAPDSVINCDKMRHCSC